MSSLVNVRELPMHTKMEVAVGHSFDVLNGKVRSVMIDSDAQPLDEAERSFYTIVPDTIVAINRDAAEVRKTIENDFRFIQGRDIKLLINRVGVNYIGVAICQPNHELISSFKSDDDE